MPMSIPELERALRSLRLSGMTATLQARALQSPARWTSSKRSPGSCKMSSTGDIHAGSTGVTRYRDCPSAKT